MHDCQDDKKEGYRKGDMWLCSDCHEQFTQQIKPQIVKKYRNITFKGFSDDKPKKDASVETEVEIEEAEVKEIEVEEGVVLGQNEQRRVTTRKVTREKCY